MAASKGVFSGMLMAAVAAMLFGKRRKKQQRRRRRRASCAHCRCTEVVTYLLDPSLHRSDQQAYCEDC